MSDVGCLRTSDFGHRTIIKRNNIRKRVMIQVFFVQREQVVITAKNVVELFNYTAFFFGNGGEPGANCGFVLKGIFYVFVMEEDRHMISFTVANMGMLFQNFLHF